jgi:cell wall-associated NlpC family hydrolase
MKNLNEYEVGVQVPGTFSRIYDNGQAISMFLQFGTKTNYQEYELKAEAQPGFAEYELLSSHLNGRSFSNSAAIKEYNLDLNDDSSFFVESFDNLNIPSAKNAEVLPTLVQEPNCSCPAVSDIEQPISFKSDATPTSSESKASSWNPRLNSGNKQTNKILDAIGGIEASSSTAENIDVSFLEDIKTILADPAVARQQSILSPEPAPTKEEDIFDRIAKNMQYANQYDFGTIELEKRLDEFDRIEDAKVSSSLRSTLPSASQPVKTMTKAMPTDISSSVFLEDMDLMNAVASPTAVTIPLDPGVGGRSILPEVLEVGDLILSTTNDPVLSAIGSATGSEVSHASMYIGNGKVIHAKAAGMEELNIHQLMDSCTLCVAYHHRDMNQTKASKILQFLRTAADNHIAFDGWGLIQAAPSQLLASYCDSLMGTARQTCLNSARSILPGTDNNDQFFCSKLIFSALKEAGLTISTIQPSFSSTQEAVRLFYDGTLHYVGHLKLQII